MKLLNSTLVHCIVTTRKRTNKNCEKLFNAEESSTIEIRNGTKKQIKYNYASHPRLLVCYDLITVINIFEGTTKIGTEKNLRGPSDSCSLLVDRHESIDDDSISDNPCRTNTVAMMDSR